MNKDERSEILRNTVKDIAWTLPESLCPTSLQAVKGEYMLYLKRFTNKGCGCFKGIEIEARAKDYSNNFDVTIIEARPFNGYKAFAKWLDDTIARLVAEREEATQQKNFETLSSLIAA